MLKLWIVDWRTVCARFYILLNHFTLLAGLSNNYTNREWYWCLISNHVFVMNHAFLMYTETGNTDILMKCSSLAAPKAVHLNSWRSKGLNFVNLTILAFSVLRKLPISQYSASCLYESFVFIFRPFSVLFSHRSRRPVSRPWRHVTP